MEEIRQLLAHYGLALVFVNVLLTQLGAPLPAVPVLVMAGALAQQGELSLAAVLAVAVLGSLLGDLPWFVAGRMFGSRVLGALCRVAVEPDSCVKQTEGIFERWGPASLMVAKFIPGFATVAPPIAGAMRLGSGRFIAYTAIGALLWAGVAVAAGMLFHTQVDWLIDWLAGLGPGAALFIGLALGFYVSVKWIERRLFLRLLRMARISVGELQEMLASGGRPLILDVRSSTARKLDPRRIPGAIGIDIDEPQRGLGPAPPDTDVVVYCT